MHAYYARTKEGLAVCYYHLGRESWDTPYWGAVEVLRTATDLKELRALPSPPQLVPCQEIGSEYDAIPANEHAAPPTRSETHQLNLNLIADIFPAKERAFVSRLKSHTSWVEYKGQLRCEVQLCAFELFTLQYYGVFYLPSLLECLRAPSSAAKANCILEMDYEGLTLQGSEAIWTSPYHIFALTSIKLVGDQVLVNLTSAPEIKEEQVMPHLQLRSFMKKGSMPLDRDVSGKQLLVFMRRLRA